jgi:hypothetical protein
MSEVYWTAPAKRVVNIFINGVLQRTGIDIWLAAGGRFRPTLYSFRAEATISNVISVGVTASRDTASVSAVEVYDMANAEAASPSPSPALPTSGPCDNQPDGSSVVARINTGECLFS